MCQVGKRFNREGGEVEVTMRENTTGTLLGAQRSAVSLLSYLSIQRHMSAAEIFTIEMLRSN